MTGHDPQTSLPVPENGEERTFTARHRMGKEIQVRATGRINAFGTRCWEIVPEDWFIYDGGWTLTDEQGETK